MRHLRQPERPARVLIVGDESALRRLLRVVLETGGYEILEAASATEALHWLAHPASLPDVIVLDLVLADAEGLDLLYRIRQHPGLAEMPVVVVTGRVSDSDRMNVLRAGADLFVAKPFSAAHLRRVVGELALEGRRRRARQLRRANRRTA